MTCWLLPTLWMDGWLYGDIQTICISFHLGHKTVVHGSNRGQFHTPTVSHDTEAVDVTPESAELKKKRASSCFCQTGHRPPCNKSFKLNLVSWLVNRLLLPHFSFTKGVESLNRWSLSVSQLWLWSLLLLWAWQTAQGLQLRSTQIKHTSDWPREFVEGEGWFWSNTVDVA